MGEKEKAKSLADVRREKEQEYFTENNTFEDFPIGVKVKIITPHEDGYFFWEETGVVIRNTGEYLGIRVKFDKPREFEGGYIQKDFGFSPRSLYKFPSVPEVKLANDGNIAKLQSRLEAAEALCEAVEKIRFLIEGATSITRPLDKWRKVKGPTSSGTDPRT